jgi:hypothetical protein
MYLLWVEDISGARCYVRVLDCRASRPWPVNLWHAERYHWNMAVTTVPNFFLFCLTSLSLHCDKYVYTYRCAETVHELPVPPNNTPSEAFLHKSGRVWKCRLDISQWGESLAVLGWILDIRQNIPQSSWQTIDPCVKQTNPLPSTTAAAVFL